MCFCELVAGNRKFGGAGGRLLTKFILQPGVRSRAAKGPQPPTDHRPNQEGNRCPEQPFDQSHLRNLRSDHTERTGFSGWSSPDDLELTILTAVAIMFSSFSTPALSALLTFFVFVIGHFSSSLRDLAENLGSNSAKIFFETVYYVVPNLSHFSFITETANGLTAPPSMIGGAFGYAIVYDILLLTITVVIFSRRNFK